MLNMGSSSFSDSFRQPHRDARRNDTMFTVQLGLRPRRSLGPALSLLAVFVAFFQDVSSRLYGREQINDEEGLRFGPE
jgi:hypothetical protein